MDLSEISAEVRGLKETAWTLEGSEDLDSNVVRFPSGGVGEHVNKRVDVVMVGIDGLGTVTVDGREHHLSAGGMVFVPEGARRSVSSESNRPPTSAHPPQPRPATARRRSENERRSMKRHPDLREFSHDHQGLVNVFRLNRTASGEGVTPVDLVRAQDGAPHVDLPVDRLDPATSAHGPKLTSFGWKVLVSATILWLLVTTGAVPAFPAFFG